MNLLEASPGSGLLAHLAAAALLYLHIGAGSLGLLSGAAALLTKKGGRWHRLAGKVFVVSMLLMSLIGACVAPFLPAPERATIMGGVMTFYLVLTGYTALRRNERARGVTDWATFMISLGMLGISLGLLDMAASSPTGTLDGQPPQAFYLFVVIGSLAAMGDAAVLFTGGYQGSMRIARHVWRMCAALFIAAASFFLGQQQIFPPGLRNSVWLLLPEIAVLLVMLYWLGHTMVSRALLRYLPTRRERATS